jgi:hypothetical protein
MLISGDSRCPGVKVAALSLLLTTLASAAFATTSLAMPAEFGPGIQGEVWVKPECPPDRNCTEAALSLTPLQTGALQFLGLDGATAGAAFTNAMGRYVVSLPPGQYQLQVDGSLGLVCPEVWMRVSGAKFRTARVICSAPVPRSP